MQEHLQHQPEQQPHDLIPSPVPKGGKWLAIALVVAAVFLLAALGIGYWLITKPAGTTTVQQQAASDGSNTVKNLSFVAATSLPAAYAARQQNTQTTQATYYFDTGTDCGITTTVQPFVGGSSAKDQAIAATKAASSYGTTIQSTTDDSALKIADTDGKHTYSFPSVRFEQSINAAGVTFTHQKNVVAYKQFGSSLATIGYSCKDETWGAKANDLIALAQAFTVKTER